MAWSSDVVSAAGGTFDREHHIEKRHRSACALLPEARVKGCETARERQVACHTLTLLHLREMKATVQIVGNRWPARRFEAEAHAASRQENTPEQKVRASIPVQSERTTALPVW
jgi:hypothetical protein